MAPVLAHLFTGNARAVYELRKSLRHGTYDAIFTNARAGVFFARRFGATPTMIDFDATPREFDEMETYESPDGLEACRTPQMATCRDMFRSARLLQAWSHWAKRSAVADYDVPRDKVIVNPPGVPLSFWQQAIVSRLGSSGRCGFLFVGGDFRRKGGELLLEWHRGMPARTSRRTS